MGGLIEVEQEEEGGHSASFSQWTSRLTPSAEKTVIVIHLVTPSRGGGRSGGGAKPPLFPRTYCCCCRALSNY